MVLQKGVIFFRQVSAGRRGIFIVVPMTVLLSHFYGMTGIWLTMPFTECLVLVIAVAGLRKKIKKDQF